MSDLISRAAAVIQLSHCKVGDDDCDVVIQKCIETIQTLQAVDNKGEWIPIKIRPDRYGDGVGILDCPLPDDGQEVLVTYSGNVYMDTFCRDGEDGCYFEGFDIDEIDAWQPLPKPYKAEKGGKK